MKVIPGATENDIDLHIGETLKHAPGQLRKKQKNVSVLTQKHGKMLLACI